MSDLRETVAESFRLAWRSRARGWRGAWCEEKLVIPAKENREKAGKFNISTFPYHIFLFEFHDRKGKGELIINKSSRAGVTFAIYANMAYSVEEDPLNALFVIDNEDNVAEEAERFKQLLKASGTQSRRKLHEKMFSNILHDFPDMKIYWRSAAAKGAFDRIEVDRVYIDEMRSFMIKDAIEQGRNRLKNTKDSKLIAFSEPGKRGDEQDKEWNLSSKSEILVHCPHCGEEQGLIFERLIFDHCKDEKGHYDLERVKDEAFYQCAGPKECRIEEHHRPLLWSKWLKNMRSYTRVRNKDHHPVLTGLQITDLHSPLVPFGETAASIIKADGDSAKMEKVDTAIKARVGEKAYGVISDKHLRALMDYSPYGYWEVPFVADDVSLVVQVIDTQLESFKTVIEVFSRSGDFAHVGEGEFETMDDCKDWGSRKIVTRDGVEIEVDCGVADEGDGAKRDESASSRRDEVREWCRENHDEGWMPIRGLGGMAIKGSIRTTEVEMDGYLHPQVVLQINSPTFLRELVYENMKNHKKRVMTGKPIMHLPFTVSEELLKELKNEYLRMKPQERGSSVMVAKWHKAGPNDYLDCIKYAKATFAFMEPTLIEAGRLGEVIEVEVVE